MRPTYSSLRLVLSSLVLASFQRLSPASAVPPLPFWVVVDLPLPSPAAAPPHHRMLVIQTSSDDSLRYTLGQAGAGAGAEAEETEKKP